MDNLIYLPINTTLETAIQILTEDKDLKEAGLTKENARECLVSLEGDILAASICLKKYFLQDENGQLKEFSFEQPKNRWAMCIAGNEKEPDKWLLKYRELYDYFLPAGRQMYGLGNPYVKNLTLSSCYADGIEGDSLEEIFNTAYRIAKTYAYGGGQGIDISVLRPMKAKVSNSAKHSTGAASFVDLYSSITGTIGQHGRRGALIVLCRVDHPDIQIFIDLKKTKDVAQYANLSVLMTDEFMKAVAIDNKFNLSFKTSHELINQEIAAKDLWNRIVDGAWSSGDPGILFWDTMKRYSPSEIYPELRIGSCNPCSEQPLEIYGNCCLGSLLLHKFVRDPFTPQASFDFFKFRYMTVMAVRHLDNVVDIGMERHPLPEQREKARLGRRIGLGITGLADCLAALGIRYDSEAALEFIDTMMDIKMDAEYLASIGLAEEKGMFPLCDKEKHYDQLFTSQLPKEIKEMGRLHGQRNVALSTVAPNGSLSIVAHCSSGCEPIYDREHTRSVFLSGEERQYPVVHPGLIRAKRAGASNPQYLFPAADEIDFYRRIHIQSRLQQKTDAAISSTINLPETATKELVGNLYMEAWKSGLKGITIFRDNCKKGVLSKVDKKKDKPTNTPIPDTICYEFLAEGGDKFYIKVSYRDGDIRRPYQIFATNYKATEHDRFVKLSNDIKKMVQEKGVAADVLKEGETTESKVEKQAERSRNTLEKITRFASLALKSGYLNDLLKILEQHGFVGTLAARLYNILCVSNEGMTHTCKACGSENVAFENGCRHCRDCGVEMCGG